MIANKTRKKLIDYFQLVSILKRRFSFVFVTIKKPAAAGFIVYMKKIFITFYLQKR